MNPLKILNSNEKNKIVSQLNKQFEIKKIPGIFLRRGAERIFLYSGDLDVKAILELEKTLPVERVGIYFGKFLNNEVRLSIEGTHFLKDQIKKNIFELNDSQVEDWMSGNELNISTGFHGFLVMKYKDDFLGCGKASELKIGNFIPKNRRLKVN